MTTFYDRVGGRAFFVELVGRFYEGVETDPLLRPLYPEDLVPARNRLTLFLVQHFGGPALYEALRGPAKLRLRHVQFAIDVPARDAWLAHMAAAIQASGLQAPEATELFEYFSETASFLVNRGLAIGGRKQGGQE